MQIFQRPVQLFHNVLPGKPPVVGTVSHWEKHLAGNHVGASPKFFQNISQENLRLTAAVSIGTVKKVYAAVVSPAQNLLRGIAGLPALQIRHPASNGHLAELQPAVAHSSVLHYDILLISFRFTRLPAASVSFCVPAWCNAAPPRDAAGSSRRPAGRAYILPLRAGSFRPDGTGLR